MSKSIQKRIAAQTGRKLTPEFEADIRRRVNPVYVDQRGTESYERAALLEEIDRLRDGLKHIECEPINAEYMARNVLDGLQSGTFTSCAFIFPKFCTVRNMNYDGEIIHGEFDGELYVLEDGDAYLYETLKKHYEAEFSDTNPLVKIS